MVEVTRKSLGIKAECRYCGSILKFQWEDMKHLEPTDREYGWSRDIEDAMNTLYIVCPVCGKKCFVRDERTGWINGTERAYEDMEKEE